MLKLETYCWSKRPGWEKMTAGSHRGRRVRTCTSLPRGKRSPTLVGDAAGAAVLGAVTDEEVRLSGGKTRDAS